MFVHQFVPWVLSPLTCTGSIALPTSRYTGGAAARRQLEEAVTQMCCNCSGQKTLCGETHIRLFAYAITQSPLYVHTSIFVRPFLQQIFVAHWCPPIYT